MPTYDTYDYVEITTSPRFGRSRTFTHHHHPPSSRPRCPPTCASITLETWNTHLEHQRQTRSENRTLRTSSHRHQADLDAQRARYVAEEDKLKRRAALLREEIEVREADRKSVV